MKKLIRWSSLLASLGLALALVAACMAAEETKTPLAEKPHTASGTDPVKGPYVGTVVPPEKMPALKPAATSSAASTGSGQAAVTSTAEPEKLSEEGFTQIFNGKDLADWMGDDVHWSVKDGAIHGECTQSTIVTGGNTFLIWKGAKPADFELRLSGKMVGGNSGIQYRSFTPVTKPEKYFAGGYQMEISTNPQSSGFIYGELWRGINMCGVGEKCVWNGGKKVVGSLGDKAEIASHFKKDDWNDYRIVAKGNHIDHYLNGIHVVDFTDEDPKALTSGVIALQIHQGYVMTVDFKNIRIKIMKEEPKADTKVAK
jgi:hypothetical protein